MVLFDGIYDNGLDEICVSRRRQITGVGRVCSQGYSIELLSKVPRVQVSPGSTSISNMKTSKRRDIFVCYSKKI